MFREVKSGDKPTVKPLKRFVEYFTLCRVPSLKRGVNKSFNMCIPYYRVNAFTKSAFGGNPAGVCPLEKWLPDELMQKIAAENNLSETAFFVRDGDKLQLRWMTPTVEVNLCGHATLATAAVLFFELGYKGERVEFETRSGIVAAARRGDLVELDFPVWRPKACAVPKGLGEALRLTEGNAANEESRESQTVYPRRGPKEVFCVARDYIAVFDSEQAVRSLAPDMEALAKVDRCVIATARGKDCDFVSRFFGPTVGIPEDPVTGSAHCGLIPFWAERIGKTEMFARQISKRGGELYCRLDGERVKIAGNAVVYQRGEIVV